MNKTVKNKLMFSVAALTAVSLIGATPVFAYGEYEGSDGTKNLNGQLTSTADYDKWYSTEWNNNENGEMNSGKVVLTPGKTERSLNFNWYSEEKGVPQVRIATKADMSNQSEFSGSATDINKTNLFHTYKATNKVSIEDYFNENTTYYYQTSIDGENWSDVTTYTTHSFSNYQAILVGDPQIGASGSNGQGTLDDSDIAVNTYSWNKTLDQALKVTAPNASFILSAGDQIDHSEAAKEEDYTIREQEYAGYTYPEVLRSVPVATTIGNHESKGDDYQLHYNNPNASTLGSTESGGDYYYTYGDALYIVLNSNNRNVEEHREFMKQAEAANPNAKWKIAMFHHDIYGSGSPHSDVDGANLRILFAPLMDEFDIDVCLTGHDHSYARTYQIVDGKVIDTDGVTEAASTAVNPEGTLYIAAGSGTGSKFYTLNTTKQYFMAERSNNPVPTFSTLDVSADALTLRTYDFEGNKYANDVTIVKNDDERESITDVKNEVQNMDTTTLTSGSKTVIDNALNKANTVLDHRDDSAAINELSSRFNQEGDPVNYYGYAQDGYKEGDKQSLKKGYSALLDKTLYENDTNMAVAKEAYEDAYNTLASVKNLVITKDEYTSFQTDLNAAKEVADKAVVGTKKGQYKQETVDAYKARLAEIESAAEESKVTKPELTDLITKLNHAKEEFTNATNKAEATAPVVPEKNDSSTTKPSTDSSNKMDKSPSTADNSNTGIFATAGLMAAVAGVVALKKRENQKA